MMLCPALGVVGADDRRVIDKAEVIPHDLMPPVGLEDMTEIKEERGNPIGIVDDKGTLYIVRSIIPQYHPFTKKLLAYEIEVI